METTWCDTCEKFQPARSGRCPSCKGKFKGAGGLKAWKAVLAISFILLAAYIYHLPYATANKMKLGFELGDPLLLEEAIDFPAVRDSVKSQLSVAFMDQMQQDESMKDNPFAGLAMAFGSSMLDGIIDSMMTPDGLAMLVSKGKVKAEKSVATEDIDPFRNADMGYRSMDVFTITMTTDDGKTRMIMTRSGLTWKVRRIELPMDILDS